MIDVSVKGDKETYWDILSEDTQRKYGFLGNRKEVVQSFLKEGKKWEAFFSEAIRNTFGQEVRDASKMDDMFKHVDLVIDGVNESILVDVKGPKKNRRTDKAYSDDIVWVEAVNGDGYKGWIYGASDYIAFVSRDSIMMVATQKLVDLYETEVKDKEIVQSVPDTTKVPYRRNGRKDIIFKLSKSDISGLCDIKVDITSLELEKLRCFK